MSETVSFGADLRARREASGLTLDEVSHKLRVPSSYLDSIEAGDFRALPAVCYGLGFLRSYCELLQVDPERYLDEYRALGRQAAKVPTAHAEAATEGGRPRWMNELVTWAAVCGVFALGWLTYTVVCRPQTQPAEIRVHAESLDDGMVVPPVADKASH